MATTYLEPVDGRKSFYGKCRIEKDGNISYLYSYTTKVAHYNHETNQMVINGWYSATTARHINSFLTHFGFDTCTKKQMESYNDNN